MVWRPCLLRGLLVLCILIVQTSDLHPDGGTIRLSEQAKGYRITIFTDPTPLRAGHCGRQRVRAGCGDGGASRRSAHYGTSGAPRAGQNEAISHAATTGSLPRTSSSSRLFLSRLRQVGGILRRQSTGSGGQFIFGLTRRPPTDQQVGSRWRRGSAGRPWRSFSSRSTSGSCDGKRFGPKAVAER